MEENKLVICAHGAECEQYIELLRDFDRDFVVADIKPQDSNEVTPDSILWEQVPFVIIGSEKNRERIEREICAGSKRCKPKIVPDSYMRLQRYHYRREEFIMDWKEQLSGMDIKVESLFCDIDEVRVVVNICDTLYRRIIIRTLRICEDGWMEVRDVRKHKLIAAANFENGIASVELIPDESELLLELVFSNTDIPYITFELEDDSCRKENQGVLFDSNAGSIFRYWMKAASAEALIHEEDYLFLRHLKNDGIIIDCGVNYGQSIRSFLAVKPDAEIIGFEANPELCDVLKSMCNKNHNIRIITKGVADEPGTTDFFYVPKSLKVSGSFLRNDIEKRLKMLGIDLPIEKRKVETTSLDEEIKEDTHIAFIKMDIEGLEYKALCGAIRIIKRDHPLLLIENHGEQWCAIDNLLGEYERYYYDYHNDRLIRKNICHSINYYMVPKGDEYWMQWIM